MSPLAASALVGLGGFAGSVARYQVALALAPWATRWPAGTFAANVLGCFVIGALACVAERTGAITPGARLLLMAGFCGGFTTMSSMVHETAELGRGGDGVGAALYVAASLATCALAFAAGALAVRWALRLGAGAAPG